MGTCRFETGITMVWQGYFSKNRTVWAVFGAKIDSVLHYFWTWWHMLKKVICTVVFDRFCGLLGADGRGWGWGGWGGPKRYVFHSKSTCGHFVTFGPKSHAKTTVFYTTFQHGALWWLLVRKSDAHTLCFVVSNRLCEKWEISTFRKVDLRQE